jgi:hypothetical protein
LWNVALAIQGEVIRKGGVGSWRQVQFELGDSTRAMPMISDQRGSAFDGLETAVLVCERAAA